MSSKYSIYDDPEIADRKMSPVLKEARYLLYMRRNCILQIRQVEKWLKQLSKKYELDIDYDNDVIHF